jgi:sugar O-acyltransferase (sialic acid O-acetyltransferase NeuD family)
MMKSNRKKPVAIIGYSGHSYVIIDILLSAGRLVSAYCDQEEKNANPYHLTFLGKENESIDQLAKYDFFPCIGHNKIREKVFNSLSPIIGLPINAIHPGAVISASATMGNGVMIAANATVNPLVKLGKGVILNTSCSIDHECSIGDFTHIAPGAVLCGDVQIGKGSFVGANSVIKQGVRIGNNVTIGAGSVIIRDILDNMTVVGNPMRILYHDISKLAVA